MCRLVTCQPCFRDQEVSDTGSLVGGKGQKGRRQGVSLLLLLRRFRRVRLCAAP